VSVTVRVARPGDGGGISRAWASAAGYYADLDPRHFQVPSDGAPAGGWDEQFGREERDGLQLVALAGNEVVGWLAARIEPPVANAAAQLTREPGWTRLVVDALIVHRDHWRAGAGTALLEAAEDWGRERGATVVRLDTYINSPVSVPFYEERMGYERRSVVFQKFL
jgi:GNAT superfamily N-acetyltransferase